MTEQPTLVEIRESKLFDAWDEAFGDEGRGVCATLRYRRKLGLDDIEAILVATKARPSGASFRRWAFGCAKRMRAGRDLPAGDETMPATEDEQRERQVEARRDKPVPVSDRIPPDKLAILRRAIRGNFDDEGPLIGQTITDGD